jgi:AcrR family transcriptional regulator
MARTLNPVAHALKRDAFVEAGQRLIATRGYEQLSIQDVLDELGASKGAFYHYFDSKQALLQAVIDRITETAAATMTPIVEDPDLTAVEKLQGAFGALAQWKGERRELMLELLRVWFSDDNTVVREHLRSAASARLSEPLTTIIRQGAAEGTFTVTSPRHAAGVVVAVIMGANEAFSRLFLARQARAVTFEEVERTGAAYAEALERILGLPPSTWPLTDAATLHTWFD